MTTELAQEFFKVFGIEPKWKDKRVKNSKTYYTEKQAQYLRETTKNRNIQLCYPEITDRKLLQLLCIYNNMQGCVELCITPCKYEDVKEMTLHFLIDEKTNITDHEEGTYMNVMTKQIQQLFKEEE